MAWSNRLRDSDEGLDSDGGEGGRVKVISWERVVVRGGGQEGCTGGVQEGGRHKRGSKGRAAQGGSKRAGGTASLARLA